MTLHPPEERDVKILDLMLAGAVQLDVKKMGSDYVLTPHEENPGQVPINKLRENFARLELEAPGE